MYLGESDIEPKRLAVMFKPARLALEYHVKSLQCDLLLEIDLDEKLKNQQSARKISESLYKTYSDVMIKSKVPENQVIKLINKIIAKRRDKEFNMNKAESPKNINVNLINTMERYPGHSPEKLLSEEKFSKSNQNFFSTNRNSNINFIDQTFQEDRDLKAELNQINQNRKSGYLDEEKEDVDTPTSDFNEGLSHSSGRGSKKNYANYDMKLKLTK